MPPTLPGSNRRPVPVGGCDFLVDPDLDATQATVVWRVELYPAVLCLTHGRYEPETSCVAANPRRWRGRVASLTAADGVYVLVRDGPQLLRLWLPKASPGTGFGVWLPFDRCFAERAALATAFWRAVAEPPVSGVASRPILTVPASVAKRRLITLRALDAALAGASYRAIAAAVLGVAEPASAREWKSASGRAAAIRLVRAGRRLMGGDYRRLLLPVKRQPRCRGVDTLNPS
jgi:hypothetical protein